MNNELGAVQCQLIQGAVQPQRCWRQQGVSGCNGCACRWRLCTRCWADQVFAPKDGLCYTCFTDDVLKGKGVENTDLLPDTDEELPSKHRKRQKVPGLWWATELCPDYPGYRVLKELGRGIPKNHELAEQPRVGVEVIHRIVARYFQCDPAAPKRKDSYGNQARAVYFALLSEAGVNVGQVVQLAGGGPKDGLVESMRVIALITDESQFHDRVSGEAVLFELRRQVLGSPSIWSTYEQHIKYFRRRHPPR